MESASSPLKKRRIDHHTETKAKADGSAILASHSNIGGDETRLNMAPFGNNSNNHEIDEDLHSRQLAVYGRETTRRLFASNVLISGMQGLGVEIAKNIILAGVKSVTLHDENLVELWDLSSNFVFSEEDVGKNRALASVQKLQELNNAVAVSTLTEKLTKEQLSAFQAVVFVDSSFEKATQFHDYCLSHQPPIAFIKVDVRGLFGSLFCDFGPQFTVLDVDGEELHSGIIASISNENPAFVSCVDDERLEFEDGDLVVFSEVEGMTELNDGKPRKIKSVKPYSFVLEEDTTSYGAFKKGGIVTQVKQPKVLNFKPLREAIKDPGDFPPSEFSKFDRPPLLHLALDRFSSQAGRFPFAGSEEDGQKLVEIAIDINESLGDARLEDINSKLLPHLAFGSRAVLNHMAAMFGGISGPEVVKACSGKFHPLYKFFYFDSLESLPNHPLDTQISVFGSTLQKKLEDARVFVVGAGPLGCEFLKKLALMGVSCGVQGTLGNAAGTSSSNNIVGKSSVSDTGGAYKVGKKRQGNDKSKKVEAKTDEAKKGEAKKDESTEKDEYEVNVYIDVPTVQFKEGFDWRNNFLKSIIDTVKKHIQNKNMKGRQDGDYKICPIVAYCLISEHKDELEGILDSFGTTFKYYYERKFYCGGCKDDSVSKKKGDLLEHHLLGDICMGVVDLQPKKYKGLELVISGDAFFQIVVNKVNKKPRKVEDLIFMAIPDGMCSRDMYIERPVPKAKPICQVTVEYVVGDGLFYVQVVEERTSRILRKVSSSSKNQIIKDREGFTQLDFTPIKDSIVLAKYDGQFHRAKIMNMNGRPRDTKFGVFFIDYGNEHTVEYESIRPMDVLLSREPGLAQRCRLAHLRVPDGDESFSQAANNMMISLTQCGNGIKYNAVIEYKDAL